MRLPNPRATLTTATREPKLVLSALLVVGALAAGSLEGCRQHDPDEIVNQGQLRPPSSNPLPGIGGSSSPSNGGTSSGAVGGTNGSGRGGASSSGSGGTGGDAGAGTGEAGTGGSSGAEPGSACAPIVPATGAFSKRRLLEATAACTQRQYCLFQEAANKLDERARELASDPTDDALGRARDAWREAMAVWEEAELFQFGPAAHGTEPGGEGLRDLVHSWPLIARCKVDENTVSQFYEEPAFFGSAEDSPSAGRTLHALEYLLFYSGTDNGCTPYSSINSSGSWSRLSASELRRRKLDYAAQAAEDVLRRADELVAAWSPDGGNFAAKLVEGSSPFESEHDALNAVNDGLFYIDRELKDGKLALPLGMTDDCPAERCPGSVEAVFAGTSADHIRRNLAGFRKLFQGCAENNAGVGFDDWLASIGAGDVAERMIFALDGVEAALERLDAPLEHVILSDPARVEAVHAAVKALTDPYKAEFMSLLNLEPPGGPGAVDND